MSAETVETSATTNIIPLPRLVRRVRGDARLEGLTTDQKVWLHLWLEEHNLTYTQVAELVLKQFGVTVSKSAVGTYWQRHCAPAEHDGQVEAAAALARLPLAEFYGATLNRARLLAYGLLVRAHPEIDTAARLLEIIRRADQQEISRERLALEKRRVALREQELAARPPRRPRATPLENQPLHASPPPPQSPSIVPQDPPPLSATSTPPPAVESPNLTAATPPQTPPNPPLFPASSSLSQPSAPALAKAPADSVPPKPAPLPPKPDGPVQAPPSPGPRATAHERRAPGAPPAWLAALASRL